MKNVEQYESSVWLSRFSSQQEHIQIVKSNETLINLIDHNWPYDLLFYFIFWSEKNANRIQRRNPIWRWTSFCYHNCNLVSHPVGRSSNRPWKFEIPLADGSGTSNSKAETSLAWRHQFKYCFLRLLFFYNSCVRANFTDTSTKPRVPITFLH